MRQPTQMPARQFAGSRKQTLAQAAGMLCAQPAFWKHLGVSTAVEAAERMRAMCGVASRSELDTNALAAQKFHDAVRRPYVATRPK